MAEAKRDENHVTTIIGPSDADGITPLLLYAHPTGHGIVIDDGLGGSDLSDDVDIRDQNHVVGFMAVSAVDGVTPTTVYINASTNGLKVRSA